MQPRYNAMRCEAHDRDLDSIVSRVQRIVDRDAQRDVEFARLQADVTAIRDLLLLLRNQWWGFIALIASSVLVALISLVVKGVR